MFVQQAVSNAYASATGARSSGTSCSNALSNIRVLQPTRTRPDPTGRVGSGSEYSSSGSGRVGSGRVKIIYCRVGLHFRLSCSPLIGMAFDLRTRKSERSQR